MTKPNSTIKRGKPSIGAAFLAATIAIVLVVTIAVSYYYFVDKAFSGDTVSRGLFGDSFGALNTVFTGLAFIGLVISIILQRNELEIVKEDLELAREELIKQNTTLAQQRFESTFFNMIQLHNQKIKDLKIGEALGRKAFITFYNQFVTNWRKLDEGKKLNLQDTLNCYLQVYEKLDHEFGHYFRNLYHTVRLVKDSEDAVDKKKYARIIRAQLSNIESVLLFYNCLTPYGKKFQPLIEEFELFKNFDVALLVNGNADKIVYKASAYGEKLHN